MQSSRHQEHTSERQRSGGSSGKHLVVVNAQLKDDKKEKKMGEDRRGERQLFEGQTSTFKRLFRH